MTMSGKEAPAGTIYRPHSACVATLRCRSRWQPVGVNVPASRGLLEQGRSRQRADEPPAEPVAGADAAGAEIDPLSSPCSVWVSARATTR